MTAMYDTTNRPVGTGAFRFALLSCLAVTVACGDGGEPLNVLLITLDTTRPDHMGCYGYGKQTTPRIDAIAAAGARFERAISTAGITPMSHSSILTGLNNYRHGMRVFYSEEVSHRLKESVDTLPEILQREGYQTAAMVSTYVLSEIYGLDQGFETFETGLDLEGMDFTEQNAHEGFWNEQQTLNTQRRSDATVGQALEWLDEHGADAPWCLWVHLFDVHDYSLVPPLEFVKAHGIQEYPREVDGRSIEAREMMYDPELAYMDAQVGRLVDWLEEHGQWDRTVIVVTADHGQGLKDGRARHGWPKHRLLYDWCIRVPLIMRIPGEAAGVVVPRAEQVRTIDILPTLLEVLDAPTRQAIEGQSLLGVLRGEPAGTRIAYADALNHYDTFSPRRGLPAIAQDENLFAVTDGRWKLIYHELRPENHELFDLDADPRELRNVAQDHPEQLARLETFLLERGAMEVEPPGTGGAVPDASALYSLGYGGGADGEEQDQARQDEGR